MAEIILSQAGAAFGAHLLPNGISVLGRTLSGALIGEAVGRVAGRAIDVALTSPAEGPRIKSLHVMESREGAGLPLVYGRMRVGGQVIWASRFKEYRSEHAGGKGGPKYTQYTYSVSFAVALCQGPVSRLDRIWANGELITLSDVNWRLYRGTEDQLPDSLIEAIEGSGQAPAYRGTAYIVFEDLPLDAFGHRLPQLSFEIVRAGAKQSDSLSRSVTGVNIIPASGEFVYATSIVREHQYPGIERALNANNTSGEADFSVSLRQLRSDLPRVQRAALTVAWFGSDLRAGACRIRPGVEQRVRETVPYAWTVDGIGRGAAHLISRTDNSPNYGGTPADEAVIEGIQALKAAGLSVTLSPFLMMDVPPGNGLPDPYGGHEQAAFPWRGRITVPTDQTQQARDDIAAFVGSDGSFGFRHFILHHARLAARAGGVEAFLIGSELIGLTRVRDQHGKFPFVEALISLAAEVKAILGSGTAVSYAADWTEYGSYVPGDGSQDILFPLDPLWASPDVDFVGVDWYPPVSDWRDGSDHLDYEAARGNIETEDYLRSQITGGEAYDWYYASAAARDDQVRSPIQDGAHGEHWIFRQKDLANWWASRHHERSGGARSTAPTAWVPSSKPVRLIEIGFPAIDKGTNAPNLFFDPKSSESAVPPFSTGARDDLLQRRALSVATAHWQGEPMVEQVLVWAWDARPWPDFPARKSVWSDGDNWSYGHWLNGRSGLVDLAETVEDMAALAGTGIDASRISGLLDGFAIDGVTSLAAAMAPLALAYEFDLREGEAGLSAHHESVIAVGSLGPDALIEASVQCTRTLLDKQPGAVSLTYISGDRSYQPAVVEARRSGAQTGVTLRYSLPLVLADGRALALAERLLAQDMARDGCTLSVPIGVSPDLDTTDRVRFAEADWIVQRIEEQGLQRRLRLRKPRLEFVRPQAIDPPEPDLPAIIPATPVARILDVPVLDHLESLPPYVAARADPWRGLHPVRVGPDASALSERATVAVPAGMGALDTALDLSSPESWDAVGELDVHMPGESLSSVSEAAVMAGQNRLLVEHDAGWELLAWRDASLIGTDRWKLTGLLRGLAGTDALPAPAGSIAILADHRLVSVRLVARDIGLQQVWQIGSGPLQSFTFQDVAGRFTT